MRKASLPILSGLVILLLSIPGCNRQPAPRETVAIEPLQLRMFAPLPEVMPARDGALTEERIVLGRMLYYETRLSKDKNISCNSCHNLATYGVDGEPTSGGHKGQRGDRNSPTVYNAAGHIAQFWDGRAPDVEEQAKGPVMNPVEMAMPSEDFVVATLKSIPGYVTAFKAAFPGQKDPVTFDNMGIAIGAFERKLITPARWDKFLKGDQAALTDDEKAGFKVFTSAGCQSCHSGALVGGALYQKLGIMRPYPDATDPGRFKVTKSESDRMMFKVPSLRNIAKTAPYFHNGKVATLEQAINQMNEYQLGNKLTDGEVKLVVAWLNSLTGEIPVDYIKPPVLPGATD
ncbi:MAG TPA: cytochrome-c peroxidase [Bryobacteraceae bacterium]|nr:cytochrome-c peroxidase [Bryobacteraceae bacterium]